MSENKYAGTQTEKNLEAAFAGESQARNKYTYFASVAKKEGYEQIADLFLRKNMQKCGLKNFRESAIRHRIWQRQQMERITSGQICMTDLQKQQRKKDFRSWLQDFVW